MATATPRQKAKTPAPAAGPSGAVSMAKLVRTTNRWRENYNPLRALTLARVVSLLETEDRGDLAELQWLYRAVERADADLLALVQRRQAALLELDWNINVVAKDKRSAAFDESLAKAQAATLRDAYERIGNLYEAVAHLALATFRGYAHCELWRDARGEIVRLEPVAQWNVVRDGLNGPWRYNPEARATGFASLSPDLDMAPEAFLIVEHPRPVDRLGVLKFVRSSLAEKDWDAWIEIYGIPGGVIIGPPNVPVDKEAQYEAAARDVAEGGSGYLPHGADYKTNDGPRNSSPFKERLDHLSEKLVLAGTGGMLTMLTGHTGLGKGPSEEHADVFKSIARGEARRLSEAFQRRVDADVLGRAFPGKPALAYFELASNEERDVQDIVLQALQLRQAGYGMDVADLGERTGYKLVAAPPLKAPGAAGDAKAAGSDAGTAAAENAPLANRAPAPVPTPGYPVAENPARDPVPPPGMSAADWQDVLGVRAQWLAPLQPTLDRILGMAADGSLTLERLLEQADVLIAQVPEVDLDADALADRLEANLGAATVSALRDSLAAHPPTA